MASLEGKHIGQAYCSDQAWRTIADLTAIGNRLCGQSGEERGAQRLARSLDEAGLLDTGVTDFEIDGWWRGESALVLDDPVDRRFDRSHEIISLPGSPSGRVEAPILDLGAGGSEAFERRDVTDALVLVSSGNPEETDRWIHRQEKYAHAVEGGAAGFLFQNHLAGGVPRSGFVKFAGAEAPIPAAGVSAEVGRRLAGMQETASSATLSIECRSGPAVSRNVEALIGPDTTNEIVVGAHLDAHDVGEGAGDDAAGCGLLTGVGQLLVAAESELETRIRLIGFGAEEAGMYGSEHWAETHDLSRVKAMINLDGVGDSRTPRLYHHGFAGLREAVEEACTELGIPHQSDDAVLPHGDHWSFVKRGVPAAMIGSGERGRVPNAHTHNDTLDKLDPRDLRDLVIALTAILIKVAEGDRQTRATTPDDVRNRMDEGTLIGLERQGRTQWTG